MEREYSVSCLPSWHKVWGQNLIRYTEKRPVISRQEKDLAVYYRDKKPRILKADTGSNNTVPLIIFYLSGFGEVQDYMLSGAEKKEKNSTVKKKKALLHILRLLQA